MRGFLRSTDTLLSLAPKITTVGRENCDITIQSPSVDLQHALVEFCEEENCYVLQDLNSAQGTYINETRIQNAAVRLAPFDQIRFGYGGSVYQFELDDVSSAIINVNFYFAFQQSNFVKTNDYYSINGIFL